MTTGRPVSDLGRAIIAGLMDEQSRGFGYWSPADLGSLLEHQLRTPLHLEAEGLLQHAKGPVRAARASIEGGVTFRDVLERGLAGDDALRMVKGWAKEQLADPQGLPRPVAHFLYIASILRATSQGDDEFSALDPTALQAEARRCLTLQWLPSEARDLLRAGLSG